jgi:Holliday junction resolvase
MPANERTETAPTTYNQRGRAVEAMAFSLLRKRGYSVIRSMRYSSAVHLVAWCDWSHPLFVHVKRTRQEVAGATDVAALWRDDIIALQAVPRWDGVSVQLWVHAGPKGWRFFEVFPGGIAEVDGHVA